MTQRYAASTMVYRDEQTGELSGLSRVISITQDDAHVFCRVNQIEDEVKSIWEIIQTFYSKFGFTLTPRLSRRDLTTLEKYLGKVENWEIAENKLKEVTEKFKHDLVCLSVPLPGNLFSALKCGHYIKKHFPKVKIAMGGGFPNTELRTVSDKRVFDYVDFITLDDGEAPLLNLLEFVSGKRQIENLKRTFCLQNNQIIYIDNS